ncbi:MAG: biotin--[acetyl-CoA-carboxylase] ligase [Gemmatimonadetes bacterium]|nr:biotin--[acetyl-CoA-carboxylase] ligase [Gemmatimonadota bacterium]
MGLPDAVIAARLDLPRVAAYTSLASTMDVAHALAADGAAAGTLVIAEEQTAGRGRGGRAWTSCRADGLWMTLIERPRTAGALDVLSLRVGLHLAPVLERWSRAPIRLKWPNDLYIGPRKLAGILIEARWRGAHPDWVAIGLGINLAAPASLPDAIGLDGADAEVVLAEVIPAVRAAAFASGPLTAHELSEFARRDLAVGQRVSLPADGLVRGISPTGELLLDTPAGVAPFRSGSLVFANT